MKKSFFSCVLVVSLVFLVNACSKQIWPRKIVFPPELQLSIDHEIEKLGTKNPVLFLVGNDGKVISLTRDGKTFKRCRPPEQPQKRVGEMKQSDERQMKAKTDETAASEIMESKLPICEGLTNVQEIYPFETVSILSIHKNPYCKVVAGPDGVYSERCLPFPW